MTEELENEEVIQESNEESSEHTFTEEEIDGVADTAMLIGRHGKTLDALQFLISSITSRTIGFRYPIVVDVEGYKGRQRQKLESIARSAAQRAATQGRNIKLRPMTPYERRIIHLTLRDDDPVDTPS